MDTVTCGCKGIRFCALCENTDRVLKLRKDDDPYKDYEFFVYSNQLQAGVKIANLNSSSTTQEIFDVLNDIIPEQCITIKLNGLLLIEEFLTEQEENDIMEMIDEVNWVPSQSGRRKQDYGPKVNFKHKKVKTDTFVGMPEYADFLLNKMEQFSPNRLGEYQPFEMCNLEYDENKKSAIEMHQDDMWIWGNRLISINLLSGSVMTLANETTKQVCYVLMPHRSLICMADDIRYQWKHGVLSRHIKGRRIALTMREPAPDFQEGGSLYEKYGKELIRLGNIRIPLTNN